MTLYLWYLKEKKHSRDNVEKIERLIKYEAKDRLKQTHLEKGKGVIFSVFYLMYKSKVKLASVQLTMSLSPSEVKLKKAFESLIHMLC